jgi:hypothetical protein
MNRKHEQSVADAFSNHFSKIAMEQGKTLNRCSLDGQDAILGADYIFTNTTKFALIEFKFEEQDIKAESKKPLRAKLCTFLDSEISRRSQSLQCHYIAWSKKRQKRTMHFNNYYPEVCNNQIFNPVKTPLTNQERGISSRVNANEVIKSFLSGEIGSNYYAFKQYTNWLMALGGHEGSTVEVMLDNPDSEQLEILDFTSLDLMKSWLDHNQPTRKNIYKPKPPSPFD